MAVWRSRIAPAIRDVCTWLDPVLTVAAAACGAAAALSPDPAHTPPLGSKQPWIIAGLAGSVVLVLVKVVAARLDAVLKRSAADQMRRVVSAALQYMHDQYFEKEVDDERYMHRITLFVCRACRPDHAGRTRELAVYARAGRYQDSATCWAVDDDEPDRCPGVAGKVWATNSYKDTSAATAWPAADDPTAKAAYADSLGVTLAEAERLRVKSLAFAGVPVMVHGKKWGVLLIDSLKDFRHTQKAKRDRQRAELEWYAVLIGMIISEGEP